MSKKNIEPHIRKGFILYRTLYEAISEGITTDREKVETIVAICEYALNGVYPQNLTGIAKVVFKMSEPVLSKERQKWINACGGNIEMAEEIANNKRNESEAEADEERNESEAEADDERNEWSLNASGNDIISEADATGHMMTYCSRKYITQTTTCTEEDIDLLIEHGYISDYHSSKYKGNYFDQSDYQTILDVIQSGELEELRLSEADDERNGSETEAKSKHMKDER